MQNNRPQNDLIRFRWDVKPYSLTHYTEQECLEAVGMRTNFHGNT